MEQTLTNVRIEASDLHHHDITPDQNVCKEIKNIAVTAEQIAENPEYVVMCKSIAVQTITNEEFFIPKQNPSLNQRPNLSVVNSQLSGGSSMEIDVSSQESVMDVASQESLSVKDSNSEDPYSSDHRISVSSHEEAILRKEEAVRNREEAVLQYEEKLKEREEDIERREKILSKMEMEIKECQEVLKIKEKQIADRETAVKIRELEVDGYRVIRISNENNGNDYLPPKRPKKN